MEHVSYQVPFHFIALMILDDFMVQLELFMFHPALVLLELQPLPSVVPVNKKRKQAKEGTGLSFKQTPVNLDIIHLISQWLTQSEFSLNSVMVYIDAGEYGVLRWKTTDQSSYY